MIANKDKQKIKIKKVRPQICPKTRAGRGRRDAAAMVAAQIKIQNENHFITDQTAPGAVARELPFFAGRACQFDTYKPALQEPALHIPPARAGARLNIPAPGLPEPEWRPGIIIPRAPRPARRARRARPRAPERPSVRAFTSPEMQQDFERLREKIEAQIPGISFVESYGLALLALDDYKPGGYEHSTFWLYDLGLSWAIFEDTCKAAEISPLLQALLAARAAARKALRELRACEKIARQARRAKMSVDLPIADFLSEWQARKAEFVRLAEEFARLYPGEYADALKLF